MAGVRIVKVCPFGSLTSLSAFFSARPGVIPVSPCYDSVGVNVTSRRIGAPFLEFFFRQLREARFPLPLLVLLVLFFFSFESLLFFNLAAIRSFSSFFCPLHSLVFSLSLSLFLSFYPLSARDDSVVSSLIPAFVLPPFFFTPSSLASVSPLLFVFDVS